MANNIPIMVANIAEPLQLATALVGHPWHPNIHVAILLGVKYSVPGLLELLGNWGDDANNYPTEQNTQVCNLKRLQATFRVTHYLLTRLFLIPDFVQTPFLNRLNDVEQERFVMIGTNAFREFTRLLKLVENHTFVGPVPIGNETLVELLVKNLEGSKPMENLRKEVDEKVNLSFVKRLKEVMDEKDREKLLQDLQEIGSANTDLLA